MNNPPLPPDDELYRALVERDASYEGIFVVGVRTTGVFCRSTCPARKPKRENVEFFRGSRDALFAGYRPCKRCRPLEPRGRPPDWLRPLLRELEGSPSTRIRDADLRARGLDPARVRRWFQSAHDMTFQAYQRALRLGGALDHLRGGEAVTHAAFDNGFESLSGFHDALKQLTGSTPARSRSATVVRMTRMLTPLGPVILGATDDALCLLEFADRRMLAKQIERVTRLLRCTIVPGSNDVLTEATSQIEAYLAGELHAFTLPLDLRGTEFQRAVWRGLLEIPYGETRSYAQQAVALGQPTAVRAVARANGDNRMAIVVPCHRVIGSDGKLTGYGGGLWRKKYLLSLEQQHAVAEGTLFAAAG